MSFAEARSDGTVEECLDELNDLMAGLQRYSPTVLAVALRVHLGTLLQALLQARLGTREEVRDFVRSWSGTRCSTMKTKVGRSQRLSGGRLQGLGARWATRVSNSSNMSGMLMAIENSRIQRRAAATSTSG